MGRWCLDERTRAGALLVEAALASLEGFLAVLSVLWRDWVEATTGLNPDRHNGSFEWAIVVVLFAVAAGFGVAARSEWRRPATVLTG